MNAHYIERTCKAIADFVSAGQGHRVDWESARAFFAHAVSHAVCYCPRLLSLIDNTRSLCRDLVPDAVL